MKPAKEFLDELEADNEALFRASELQVKDYFAGNRSKAELIEHFTGRMVNERMNLIEISQAISKMPAGADIEELNLLAKQAHDEAKHFRWVKQVVEHLSGEPLDVERVVSEHAKKLDSKGAAIIKKYNADSDEAMLGLYQLIAEGRAARVWQMMADVIEDDFISSRYAKIARDEKFHSRIGRRKLQELCEDAETQDRISAMVNDMRKDLFKITCAKTGMTAENKKIIEDAYGPLAVTS